MHKKLLLCFLLTFVGDTSPSGLDCCYFPQLPTNCQSLCYHHFKNHNYDSKEKNNYSNHNNNKNNNPDNNNNNQNKKNKPSENDELEKHCPKHLIDFWACIDYPHTSPSPSLFRSKTFAPITALSPTFTPIAYKSSTTSSYSSSSSWSKSCCELALTSLCRYACLKAKTQADIEPHCSRADGNAVYQCFNKHEEGQKCCQQSSNNQCYASCKALFIQDTPPDQLEIDIAIGYCDNKVAKCIRKRFHKSKSDATPHNAECCEASSKPECVSICREVLKKNLSENEMVEKLEQMCGIPDPSEKLWQCFLMKSNRNKASFSTYEISENEYNDDFDDEEDEEDDESEDIEDTNVMVGGRDSGLKNIDEAKAQCCFHASSVKCRSLCETTFGRGWTDNINVFAEHCKNKYENMLNSCLEEVDDRCRLGCSNLTYCGVFNHLPTHSFRRCDDEADYQARHTLQTWIEERLISLPDILHFDIPVKDISTCQPMHWKMVSCILHIKPCSTASTKWICKRDCLGILDACLDRERMSMIPMTINQLCDLLSAGSNDNDCISVQSFLDLSNHKIHYPTRHRSYSTVFSTPCSPNPCQRPDDVCVMNKEACHQTVSNDNFNVDFFPFHNYKECSVYKCLKGCPMGELMSQLVAPDSLVKLSDSANKNCYQLCICGNYGNWVNCTSICDNSNSDENIECLLSSGMIIADGSTFQIDCNTCVCSSRQALCSKRFCQKNKINSSKKSYLPGLPCDCPSKYQPVCTHNGQTFSNPCLAECNGFQKFQWKRGTCGRKTCGSESCKKGEKCIQTLKTCLGGSLIPNSLCPSHVCVNANTCKDAFSSSLCDTKTNRKYFSLCEAAKSNSTSLCPNYCQSNCRRHGKVCGLDGVTYLDECEAKCFKVPINYNSACHAIQLLKTKLVRRRLRCQKVQCLRRNIYTGCKVLYPPDSCCPVCAGMIKSLIDQRQALRLSHHYPLTNHATTMGLAQVLESLLSVKECSVSVYLSTEKEAVILVTPSIDQNKAMSNLLIEACMKETLNLHHLIAKKHPSLTSYAVGFLLLSSTVKISSLSSTSYYPSSSSYYYYSRSSATVDTCNQYLVYLLLGAVLLAWDFRGFSFGSLEAWFSNIHWVFRLY